MKELIKFIESESRLNKIAVLKSMSAEDICDLLDKQDEEITELKALVKQIHRHAISIEEYDIMEMVRIFNAKANLKKNSKELSKQ